MSQLVPGIGVRGIYSLKAPFAAKLVPNTPYTCVAVRQLSDIVATGADPQETYYTPYGLDDAAYQADLAAQAVIVSLQASTGVWLYVPSTYVLAMPAQGGVDYTTLALACSLGPVPNALDLSYVKGAVAQLCADNLGLDPVNISVHEVAISLTSQVSATEHAALEAARAARKTESTTDRSQVLALTAQRDALATRVQALEAAMADAIAKGYTGTASPPAPAP